MSKNKTKEETLVNPKGKTVEEMIAEEAKDNHKEVESSEG